MAVKVCWGGAGGADGVGASVDADGVVDDVADDDGVGAVVDDDSVDAVFEHGEGVGGVDEFEGDGAEACGDFGDVGEPVGGVDRVRCSLKTLKGVQSKSQSCSPPRASRTSTVLVAVKVCWVGPVGRRGGASVDADGVVDDVADDDGVGSVVDDDSVDAVFEHGE